MSRSDRRDTMQCKPKCAHFVLSEIIAKLFLQITRKVIRLSEEKLKGFVRSIFFNLNISFTFRFKVQCHIALQRKLHGRLQKVPLLLSHFPVFWRSFEARQRLPISCGKGHRILCLNNSLLYCRLANCTGSLCSTITSWLSSRCLRAIFPQTTFYLVALNFAADRKTKTEAVRFGLGVKSRRSQSPRINVTTTLPEVMPNEHKLQQYLPLPLFLCLLIISFLHHLAKSSRTYFSSTLGCNVNNNHVQQHATEPSICFEVNRPIYEPAAGERRVTSWRKAVQCGEDNDNWTFSQQRKISHILQPGIGEK